MRSLPEWEFIAVDDEFRPIPPHRKMTARFRGWSVFRNGEEVGAIEVVVAKNREPTGLNAISKFPRTLPRGSILAAFITTLIIDTPSLDLFDEMASELEERSDQALIRATKKGPFNGY
jgi:hypothetical protein